MSSSFIAQLAFNEEMGASNKYKRFSYGCKNFQRIFFEFDEVQHGTGNVDYSDIFITIYAGSVSVCNRVPVSILSNLWMQQAGTGVVSTGTTTDEMIFSVDVGSHYMTEEGSEVYVAIDGPSLNLVDFSSPESNQFGVRATVHVECNALTKGADPQSLALYTDQAFIVENCVELTVHGSALDESSGTVTTSYGDESITQPLSGLNAVANCETIGDSKVAFGYCYNSEVPRTIQTNTSTGSLSFLARTLLDVTDEMNDKASTFVKNKLKTLSKKELGAMVNRG